MDDRLSDSTAIALKLADTVDGTSWFEGEIPLDRTGSYGYTVRALPKNDLLASPAELGVVAIA
jgi:starch phosphorylase